MIRIIFEAMFDSLMNEVFVDECQIVTVGHLSRVSLCKEQDDRNT
jgi:hypothetical protein